MDLQQACLSRPNSSIIDISIISREHDRSDVQFEIVEDRHSPIRSAVYVLPFIVRTPIPSSRVYRLNGTIHSSSNGPTDFHKHPHFQIGPYLTKISTPIGESVMCILDLLDAVPSSPSHVASPGPRRTFLRIVQLSHPHRCL